MTYFVQEPGVVRPKPVQVDALVQDLCKLGDERETAKSRAGYLASVLSAAQAERYLELRKLGNGHEEAYGPLLQRK